MTNGNLAQVRAFVFDLDGTLIDSKMDLVHAVNAMLRATGRPEQGKERVASYIGHGAPQLIASVLGAPSTEEQRREALAVFLTEYEKRMLELTRAYPAVEEGLRALDGFPMAVLTNKPLRMAVEILQGLALAEFFDAVYGGDSFEKKKPDPTGALTILKEFGVAPEEAAMVGDSDVDVQTARNAGMQAVGVKYGFGVHDPQVYPADVYVDRLTELRSLASNKSA
ncbi:MAG TPA: HAD-IA family hydrolase [Candidatus Sulfotelmatobacter sp.]|nr:HAD-IA family hydrolase [Candidatus Sulfotelmatobacter sp.]